jgi:hypothetical protein
VAERNFTPKTIYQNQREIVRYQPPSGQSKPFADGAFQDLDGALIPANGVHKLYNYRAKRNGLEARGGSKLWSETTLPGLEGRTGYSLTKSGTTVTKTVGDDFSADDADNYIVYDDGAQECISAVISATQVTMENATEHDASTSAYIRGPINSPLLYHEKKEMYVLFIDRRFFYSDTITIDSWTEIVKSGTFVAPRSSISDMRIFDDGVVLYNQYGLYKIDLDNLMYWRINSPIPDNVLTTEVKEVDDVYCRRELYKMARLDGAGQNGKRYESGVSILQESGTVLPDTSDNDFAEIWTERPIGPGDTTYGKLYGDSLVAPYDTVVGWQTFTVGQFRITINGDENNVVVDLTGVISMEQVASRIQTALRDYYPNALCEYSSGSFIIISPDEGGSVSVTSAGDGATDIGSSIMSCQSGMGDAQTPNYTRGAIVGDFEIPIDSETGLYDAHWNRYVLCSTLDVGELGSDPLSGTGNNTELYIWNTDIPVAKAFTASMSGITITLTAGEFVPGDNGSRFRFQNGDEYDLVLYISSTQFFTAVTGTQASQSAAIGGDNSLGKAIRIITIQQSATTVTRQSGDLFTSDDVGRILFLSDGTEIHVVSYTDASNVEVLESAMIAVDTAACIEPKTRKWYDTVRDNPYLTSPNLRSRITNYSLQNRFFIPMPNCNLGEVTANMLWAALRKSTVIYYCPADTNYRYQVGYHYQQEQREFVQDAIMEMSEIGDYLSIKCIHTTRALPLNTFTSYELPYSGTAIIKCAGNFMVDEHIGIKGYGGVCKVDRKQQIVITSEPGIRIFNGQEYGENLATDRIIKELESMKAGYACCYDPINGFTFWGFWGSG